MKHHLCTSKKCEKYSFILFYDQKFRTLQVDVNMLHIDKNL